jgi:hypothetical protein
MYPGLITTATSIHGKYAKARASAKIAAMQDKYFSGDAPALRIAGEIYGMLAAVAGILSEEICARRQKKTDHAMCVAGR